MDKNTKIKNVMDKKKIKYFYFDMDGTLLNDQKVLSEENIFALKKLMQAGYKVGLITGRPDYMIKKEMAKIKPNLPLVSINGGKIIDTNNKILNFNLIDSKTFKKISNFLMTNNITFLAYGEDIMYYYLHDKKNSNFINRYKNTINNLETKFKWELKSFGSLDVDFYKIFIFTKEITNGLTTKLKEFINTFNDIYCVNSAPGSLDVMPSGISKGLGLKILEQNKIIDLKKTFVFGDAENDISMFKLAAISVSMQNANEIVKKATTFVNKFSNNESGVALFVKDVIFND